MQERGAPPLQQALFPGLETALFFETPAQIYARVFSALKPRTRSPEIEVEFCPFVNADSFIRMENGRIKARISDLLKSAPAPVAEALAYILLGKLLRRPVPKIYSHRYRLYLNRRDMRRRMNVLRQLRGRKFNSGPQGRVYNLELLFEQLNARFFDGLLRRPALGWSRRPSRTLLGHFDPAHDTVIISRVFDDPRASTAALEYVLFHEMLHLQFPVEHRGARRRVHTREFLAAERAFPGLADVKKTLKAL